MFSQAAPATSPESAPSKPAQPDSETAAAAAAAPAVRQPTLKPDAASAPNGSLHSNNPAGPEPVSDLTQADGIHPGSPNKSAQPTANLAADGTETASPQTDTPQGLAACEGQLDAFGRMCGLTNQQKLQAFLKLVFQYQEVRGNCP